MEEMEEPEACSPGSDSFPELDRSAPCVGHGASDPLTCRANRRDFCARTKSHCSIRRGSVDVVEAGSRRCRVSSLVVFGSRFGTLNNREMPGDANDGSADFEHVDSMDDSPRALDGAMFTRLLRCMCVLRRG